MMHEGTPWNDDEIKVRTETTNEFSGKDDRRNNDLNGSSSHVCFGIFPPSSPYFYSSICFLFSVRERLQFRRLCELRTVAIRINACYVFVYCTKRDWWRVNECGSDPVNLPWRLKLQVQEDESEVESYAKNQVCYVEAWGSKVVAGSVGIVGWWLECVLEIEGGF